MTPQTTVPTRIPGIGALRLPCFPERSALTHGRHDADWAGGGDLPGTSHQWRC